MNSNISQDAAVTAEVNAAPEVAPEAPARFDTLPLDPKILSAIAYPTMTPIQAKAIPPPSPSRCFRR